MLRIAIDANPILKKNLTGIGTYTLNLLRHVCDQESHTENFLIFYNARLKKYFEQYNGGQDLAFQRSMEQGVSFSLPPDWEYGRYTKKLMDFIVWNKFSSVDVNIFHGTSFTLPLLPRRIKKIVTVHDLAFLRIPSIENGYISARLKALTAFSCHDADKIIAVSQATKNDIKEFFDVPDEKIKVIYEGVDQGTFAPQDFDKKTFKAMHKLPENFILFVGATNRRKNLLVLIKAMRYLPKDIKLVIVGKAGNQHEEIIQMIDAQQLNERIVFAGYCSDQTLAGFYMCARAFVFPSLYEGFGLPVLEAMRFGVPVLTSNNSSLKELFAQAAVLLDHDDEQAWSDSIKQLLNDPAMSENLGRAGLELTKKFSWEKMGRETLDLYREVSSGV